MANIYLITGPAPDWDKYGPSVVVAESQEDARYIYPGGPKTQWYEDKGLWLDAGELELIEDGYTDISAANPEISAWVPPQNVRVELLGLAVPILKSGTVLCAPINWS